MTHAAQFWEWHYLIFLLPGVLALLLLLVSSAFSLGGDSDSGVEAEGEIDGDSSGASDSEADGETGNEAEDEHSGLGAGLLRLVGADKAPLSLAGGAFFLGWGFFGFWADEMLAPWLLRPLVFIGPALALALTGAILTARATAAVAARVIPKDASTAISLEAIAGHEARAVYPISQTTGRAIYYDKNAVLHDVTCRIRPGENPIPKGQIIILVDYDPKAHWFWAEPSPFSDD